MAIATNIECSLLHSKSASTSAEQPTTTCCILDIATYFNILDCDIIYPLADCDKDAEHYVKFWLVSSSTLLPCLCCDYFEATTYIYIHFLAIGAAMAWYSLLPDYLSVYETWIVKIFVREIVPFSINADGRCSSVSLS